MARSHDVVVSSFNIGWRFREIGSGQSSANDGSPFIPVPVASPSVLPRKCDAFFPGVRRQQNTVQVSNRCYELKAIHADRHICCSRVVYECSACTNRPERAAPNASAPASADAASSALPAWAIGPFARQANPEPVIKPDPSATFLNPINQETVHWEKAWVYNPAAVARDGKIVVLYRSQQGPGNTCSRIGYAQSDDGFHFTQDTAPVYYPMDDDQKIFEWKGLENSGGCEDPRVAEAPDGSYRLTYSEYGNKGFRIGIASSTDLKQWTKLGGAFAGSKWETAHVKSAAIVHEIKDGKLVAAKINGSYLMYFGENSVHLATSDDMTHWKPMETPHGQLLTIMTPRSGFFDSKLTEVGCQSLLTKNGIVVFYNGANDGHKGDPSIGPSAYAGGQALFDLKDPTHLIARLDKPFIQPTYPWEKTGLFKYGTTFIEGLTLFHDKWFLYFGCADSFVGAATRPIEPGSVL